MNRETILVCARLFLRDPAVRRSGLATAGMLSASAVSEGVLVNLFAGRASLVPLVAVVSLAVAPGLVAMATVARLSDELSTYLASRGVKRVEYWSAQWLILGGLGGLGLALFGFALATPVVVQAEGFSVAALFLASLCALATAVAYLLCVTPAAMNAPRLALRWRVLQVLPLALVIATPALLLMGTKRDTSTLALGLGAAVVIGGMVVASYGWLALKVRSRSDLV